MYTDFCRIILLLSLGAWFGNTLVIVLTIGGAPDFVQCGLLSDDSCPVPADLATMLVLFPSRIYYIYLYTTSLRR